ncbi:CopG family transcriptional regulator [Clostridium botulinum]|uniref:CopG family transcriptional regulator n=2 Tax=Clostridium botulinum TaxID=1491 RepID=C4IXH8_CLOBO|nr:MULTISPECIES: hypothetical protein [Clostridium]ACT33585.1 conserved hypothetical protein [Clostridium botulinum D str. 1873]AYF55308.1 CopG family transcriptional regulator [Clostridium novyi]MBO3442770.1 CopG family transcriptional regulator [Clostridium haemolyticum]MCD3245983.1 CopG family transcriptional regulator [Clostridium botulinum C]MCD3262482.1 CopG family transcriptional regulator [Clostridium botulinum C]
MSNNFKDSIKSNMNIKNESNEVICKSNTNIKNETFVLKKKEDEKSGKKAFNVYISEEKLRELDKMSKKSRYSRNELVNLMFDYCLEHWKVED